MPPSRTRSSANTASVLAKAALFATASMAACLLAGCAQKDNAELLWARAALERNPQLKVVSVDEAANTIKVRVKITGEVLTLTPGELGAAPIADLVAHVAPPAPPPEPAATAAEPPTEPVAVTEPAPAAPMPTEPATYTVQREDGRVRVSGPGVSIETAPKSTQATPESSTRYDEPIICDGRRFMHFDNRTLTVDGDALIARGGCELHITNSRITATGTALTVLDATVHITNSTLIGNSSSLTTSSAARVFLRNNQFTGLARRSPDAKLQDQGGNIWR